LPLGNCDACAYVVAKQRKLSPKSHPKNKWQRTLNIKVSYLRPTEKIKITRLNVSDKTREAVARKMQQVTGNGKRRVGKVLKSRSLPSN
jgi:hypothetical protein